MRHDTGLKLFGLPVIENDELLAVSAPEQASEPILRVGFPIYTETRRYPVKIYQGQDGTYYADVQCTEEEKAILIELLKASDREG